MQNIKYFREPTKANILYNVSEGQPNSKVCSLIYLINGHKANQNDHKVLKFQIKSSTISFFINHKILPLNETSIKADVHILCAPALTNVQIASFTSSF